MEIIFPGHHTARMAVGRVFEAYQIMYTCHLNQLMAYSSNQLFFPFAITTLPISAHAEVATKVLRAVASQRHDFSFCLSLRLRSVYRFRGDSQCRALKFPLAFFVMLVEYAFGFAFIIFGGKALPVSTVKPTQHFFIPFANCRHCVSVVAMSERDSLLERLSRLLLEHGYLSSEALARGEEVAARTNVRLPAALTRLGLLSEAELSDAFSILLEIPRIGRDVLTAPKTLPDDLNPVYLKSKRVLPISISNDQVELAMADPLDEAVLSAVQFRISEASIPGGGGRV